MDTRKSQSDRYLDCNLGAGRRHASVMPKIAAPCRNSERKPGVFSVLRPAPPAALLRNGEKERANCPGFA